MPPLAWLRPAGPHRPVGGRVHLHLLPGVKVVGLPLRVAVLPLPLPLLLLLRGRAKAARAVRWSSTDLLSLRGAESEKPLPGPFSLQTPPFQRPSTGAGRDEKREALTLRGALRQRGHPSPSPAALAPSASAPGASGCPRPPCASAFLHRQGASPSPTSSSSSSSSPCVSPARGLTCHHSNWSRGRTPRAPSLRFLQL